jgi:hypothetical protein
MIMVRYSKTCLNRNPVGMNNLFSLPRGLSESVYLRKTDNTMAKRKSTKGQTTISTIYLDIPMIPMDGAYH